MSFVGFAEPQVAMLRAYSDALRRGWSPNTIKDVSQQELAEIEADSAAFLATRADQTEPTGTLTLPDGREVARLPMRIRWIWDGDFCGAINLRWQPGTDDLPEHVLGHIGYTVVPWKRGHRLATKALRHMLKEAAEIGLKRVVISTDDTNVASQRVVENNGGVLVEHYRSANYAPDILRRRYAIDI